MVCVYCGHKTQVTNSRSQKRLQAVWRRRQCLNCDAIFTTQEQADLGSSVGFLNKQGVVEPFNRQTLFLSLYDSLRHRSTAQQDATALTATVISKLLPLIEQAQLDRTTVVKTAAPVLKRFDSVAAVSYGAFHPIS
jgi:transcriptional regulator NrdR family protein